ncbi:hypothetical protein MLD38_008820 [Melastoma candidum]|uniref:Uncharacterized protein n=1 Tax=Melastoma candidum TaxID=119954 RepID=A0ACB9RYM4_9MYRT|nr:hypothetical protein MLD38_008820 [Melastoma candidum]
MGVRTVGLVTYSDEIIPINVASNCLPVKASNLEPSAHAFHSAVLRLLGLLGLDKKATGAASFDSYGNKGKKKGHYSLLGLSHLRYLATEDQIKKSYRETALKYHSDKQAALLLAEETEAAKQAKKDEVESHFKAIQEAYEF